MGDVIKKPVGRLNTVEGPLYVTDVDGAVVHGGKAMTAEQYAGVQKIVAAAKRYMERRS